MADLVGLTDLTAIQRTISYVDSLPSAVTTTATADKTARYTQYLQEGILKYWMAAEWPWTMRTATLAAISATGQANLPTNFLEVTSGGFLLDTATGTPFQSVEIQDMHKYNKQLNTSRQHYYAIGFALDEVGTRYIYVPKAWVGCATLSFTYKKIAPAVDIGTVPPAKPALTEIPSTYHYTFFIPYMRFRAFEDKKDAAAGIWLQESRDGLQDALRTERIGIQKDTIQRLGSSGLAKRMS